MTYHAGVSSTKGETQADIWRVAEMLEEICLLTQAELDDLDFMRRLVDLLGQDRGMSLIGASKLAQVFLAMRPAPGRPA